MVVWLRIVSGACQGQSIQLGSRQYVSLGRTLRADFALKDDPRVSQLHCRVEHDGVRVLLQDLGSTNGTFVNEQNVREAELCDGDKIRVGSTEIMVVFQGSHESDAEHAETPYAAPPPADIPLPNTPPVGAPYQPRPLSELPGLGSGLGAAGAGGYPSAPPAGDYGHGGGMRGGISSGSPIMGSFEAPSESGRGVFGGGQFSPGSGGYTPASPPLPVSSGRPVASDYMSPPSSLPVTPSSTPPASSDSGHRSSPFGESIDESSVFTPRPSSTSNAVPTSAEKSAGPLDSAVPGNSGGMAGHGGMADPVIWDEDDETGDSSLDTADELNLTGTAPEPTAASSAALPTNASTSYPNPAASQPHSDSHAHSHPHPTSHLATQSPPRRVVVAPRVIAAVAPEARRYSRVVCPSGLHCFVSTANEEVAASFAPSGIVDTIVNGLPAMAVLHFQKIGQTTPPELNNATPLMDWLPIDSSLPFGPVLIRYQQLRDDVGLDCIDQLWGSDGCLIFLGQDPQAMYAHLSQLIHQAIPGFSPEGGIFYYCWPSVLGQLLGAQPVATISAILGNAIQAVVMESFDPAVGWRVFATSDFERHLQAVGFQLES